MLCSVLSSQLVDVRPADGRSDATNEDDDDSTVPDDSNVIAGKPFDADENKYREKPRKAHNVLNG